MLEKMLEKEEKTLPLILSPGDNHQNYFPALPSGLF